MININVPPIFVGFVYFRIFDSYQANLHAEVKYFLKSLELSDLLKN